MARFRLQFAWTLAAAYGGLCSIIWVSLTLARDSLRMRRSIQLEIAESIMTGDVFDVRTKFPGTIASIFNALFTDRVASFAGFRRSALFSLLCTAYLLVLWYLHIPQNIAVSFHGPRFYWENLYEAFYQNSVCFSSEPYAYRCLPTSVLWLMPIFYSLVMDWIALIATQTVIRLYPRNLLASLLVTIIFTISLATISVILASILWRILFDLKPLIVQILNGTPFYLERSIKDGFEEAWSFFLDLVFSITCDRTAPATPFVGMKLPFWNPLSVYGVFIVSTMAGGFWVLLIFMATILARVAFRLRPFGPLLDSFFLVSENPLQFLAIVLMFGLAVAFLILFAVVELIDFAS